jgi:hypothetical protein
MSAPICSCTPPDLEWELGAYDGDNPGGMTISCHKCNTKLIVPEKKLEVNFAFDTLVPTKKNPAKASKTKEKSVSKDDKRAVEL